MYPPFKVFLFRPKQRVPRICCKTCNNYCHGGNCSLLFSRHIETVHSLKSKLTIGLWSDFFLDIQRGETAAYKFLAPIIEERRRMIKHPDYQKPVKSFRTMLMYVERSHSMADGLSPGRRNQNRISNSTYFISQLWFDSYCINRIRAVDVLIVDIYQCVIRTSSPS